MKMNLIFIYIIVLTHIGTQHSFADNSDYWTKNKTMNLPKGVATTTCSYFNELNISNKNIDIINELYKRWMKGWVSGFAMYSDWDVRDIEDNEYIDFLKTYCIKFPQNNLSRAAHTFTYRIKKSASKIRE
tara:strand:+ start:1505 stop:1894 length:390 start_codon:yes stop_codon:yes gene_type:complete